MERFQPDEVCLMQTRERTGISYCLFAYREVPQASTGFSPLELVYGRAIRGPLDILKDAWVTNEKSDESVVSHILSVQENLSQMSNLIY